MNDLSPNQVSIVQPAISHPGRPPAVYRAMCKVTKELARIGVEKDGYNDKQRFHFRSIDAIRDALAPELAAAGLVILPAVLSREVTERRTTANTALFNVSMKVALDIVCAEDGSMHRIETYGEGSDSGDKATSKAMTAAFKSAVTIAFCIPVQGHEGVEQEDGDYSTPPEVLPKQAAPEAPRQPTSPEVPRQPTRGEWMDALAKRLSTCENADAIEIFVSRESVQTALSNFDGNDLTRLQKIIADARARFQVAEAPQEVSNPWDAPVAKDRKGRVMSPQLALELRKLLQEVNSVDDLGAWESANLGKLDKLDPTDRDAINADYVAVREAVTNPIPIPVAPPPAAPSPSLDNETEQRLEEFVQVLRRAPDRTALTNIWRNSEFARLRLDLNNASPSLHAKLMKELRVITTALDAQQEAAHDSR